MADETDTSGLESETDNVIPSETDTPFEWDYFDPDEDQPDTEEVTADEGTEDEAGETEEQPEPEGEEDSEETAEDQPPAEASPDAVVRLADGTETTVAELTKGHMRQADYTRKSQELSTQRQTVSEQASQLENTLNAFIDHLSAIVPAMPDANLAYSDPQRFNAQKAQHDAAMAKVQELIQLGNTPKQVQQGMSDTDRRDLIARENQSLVEMFPETGTKDGRERFFGDVQQVAHELGFSNEELTSQTDHRLFALAHWAKKGMEAEKARSTAKAKVQKAKPAAAPSKPGQPARNANRNRDAMKKLGRSGSMKDALAVDFD